MFTINKLAWYLIGGALGLVLGVGFYFAQPVRWKGYALVRIGQYSQTRTIIEPPSTVVERLRSPPFIKAVAERAKNSELIKLLNEDEGGGMVIRTTKNSDALEIAVFADSEEIARSAIDAIVSELISKHQAILNSYQVDTQRELVQLGLEIEVHSKRIETASQRSSGGDKAAAGFFILAIQHVLDLKINRSWLLRESLSSANARPTSLVESAAVSEKRAFTSLWRTALLGMVLGLVVSFAWLRFVKYGTKNS